ncbi:hypothetical protein [Arenimonas sp. MALMAid1274]|uniref:hypothetical protein n=1 Tax=Arenimonas sp. MALMAid1274 TaxID=3411630 RepID=UPI003B9FDD2D
MSLEDKIAAVQRAELDCVRERQAAAAAYAHLKAEIRRSATPFRIVAGGFSLGVASGIGLPGTKSLGAAGGRFVTGPLFSMLLESVLPGMLAGITAASAAEEAVQETVPGAVQDAVDEAVETAVDPAGDALPAKPRPARKRKPRKRRVDTA